MFQWLYLSAGSMLGNYGGHSARVFRVEFSPSDPDLLFSAAEENALHQWRPSKLTCKTPAQSNGEVLLLIAYAFVQAVWLILVK